MEPRRDPGPGGVADMLRDESVAALSEPARRAWCTLLQRQPAEGLSSAALERLASEEALAELRRAGLLAEVWAALEPCESAPEGLPARYRAQTPGQRDGAEVFAATGGG